MPRPGVSPNRGAAFRHRRFIGGCKTPNSGLNGWPPSQSGSHRTDPPQLFGEKCLTRYLANLFPPYCRGALTQTNEVPSLLWRSLRDLNSRRVSSDLGLAIRPLTGSGKAAYCAVSRVITATALCGWLFLQQRSAECLTLGHTTALSTGIVIFCGGSLLPPT